MLTIVEKVVFLQNVDIFADMPAEQLTHLASIAREVSFLPGDVIYKENDPSDSLYVLMEGKVELTKDGQKLLELGAKEALGTWALFENEPRVVSATVKEDVNALRIDRDEFFDLLADNSDLSKWLLRSLFGRVKKLQKIVEKINPQANFLPTDDKLK